METNDNETCCRKFGARIAKLRSGKGKTQEAFAEECGSECHIYVQESNSVSE